MLFLALDFNDGMLPFHRWTNGRQPSKTIETNGCLTPKPSKNHWTQWLPLTIPFNGDGAFQNHWNFAMVAKCGPKSPKSFDHAFSLQNGLVTLKWFIYPLSVSSSAFVRKWDMSRLQAFLRSFKWAKTIVDHRTRIWGNHWKTIDSNGQSVKKTFNGDG